MGLVEVHCDYCSHSKYKTKLDFGQYRIIRCRHCQLDYLSPRPDDETLANLYTKEYFNSENFDKSLVELDANTREKLINQQFYILNYIERYIQTGELLEIGCATGHLLEYARRSGFSVKGIEFSEAAANLARQLTHAPIFIGDLETAIQEHFLAKESCDVIVMAHVLEHMKSPKVALQQLFDVLKPGGITIIRVPDFGGLDAFLKGKDWDGLRIPYHLYHFRPPTLQQYLRTTGFEVLEFDYSLHRAIVQPLLRLKRVLQKSVHSIPEVESTPQPKNLRSAETVTTRKTVSTNNNLVKQILYPLRGRTMTFVARKP
jgi:SAM-dependent methyltransferase